MNIHYFPNAPRKHMFDEIEKEVGALYIHLSNTM